MMFSFPNINRIISNEENINFGIPWENRAESWDSAVLSVDPVAHTESWDSAVLSVDPVAHTEWNDSAVLSVDPVVHSNKPHRSGTL